MKSFCHFQDLNTNVVVAGDQVYDLLGLDVGQAVGGLLLVVLLLAGGSTAVWIWSYRQSQTSRQAGTVASSSYSGESLLALLSTTVKPFERLTQFVINLLEMIVTTLLQGALTPLSQLT